MKKLLTPAIALLAIFLSTAFAAPDKIVITPGFVRAHALTQVDNANLTCSLQGDDSGTPLDTASTPLSIRSLDDLNTQLASVQLDFTIENPKEDAVLVEANLTRGSEIVFTSVTGFMLEKGYDADGKVQYVVPSWGNYLYFTLISIEIPVPDVESIVVSGEDGDISIQLGENGFVFDQEVLDSLRFGTLVVEFSNGEIASYDNTGNIIQEIDAKFQTQKGQVHVDGILKGEPWKNTVDIQLGPEYGYNPSVEVPYSRKGLQLVVRSFNGYEPKFVHVTSYEDLALGKSATILRYSDYMKITTPAKANLLWFEWDEYIYDPYFWDHYDPDNSGGKG